jgi:hypothetical protein
VAHALEAVLVGPEALARIHAGELPQKDNLCGCFWASIALRAAGFEADQDDVAVEAGTILPEPGPESSVPPGESPRVDYRFELPLADVEVPSGTAARGLAAAVERLSGGDLAVVPVAAPWNAESVVRLVDVCGGPAADVVLVANVRTGLLWGTRPDPPALLAYLAGGDPPEPEPEWDVGHFVNVAGTVRAGERALVLVRDSYRSLGWEAHHLQPAETLAAALRRDDGREGGVLCVARAADADALRGRLAAAGFELRHWDNGTPFTPTGS